MISVSDEVLARWGVLSSEGRFDIDLQVLVKRGAVGAIKEVLREVIEEQVTELNAVVDATRPQAGKEPPWPSYAIATRRAAASVPSRRSARPSRSSP